MGGFPGGWPADNITQAPRSWRLGADNLGQRGLLLELPGLAGALSPMPDSHNGAVYAGFPVASATQTLNWRNSTHAPRAARALSQITPPDISPTRSVPLVSRPTRNAMDTSTPKTQITPSTVGSPLPRKAASEPGVTRVIRGIASLYNLPGHRTSSGERFAGNRMVAAMRPQDVPNVRGQSVWARVTYTRPGSNQAKSIIVRINDHGPFEVDPKTGRVLRDKTGKYVPSATRVIDLPTPLFEELGGPGSTKQGLLKGVKVELLESGPINAQQ